MALSVLISAWLVGALGGLHCAAMCGGLLTAASARDRSTRPLLPARVVAMRQLTYQAGRVATYGVLGTAFGSAGAWVLGAADFLWVQRVIHVAANLFLLLLGISLALGTPGLGWLQRAGTSAFAVVLPVVRSLLQRPDAVGRVTLGLVWGLMPCALVYSVLPLALFAGGAWQGGATMLAFGLGTVPNLVAGGMLLDQIVRRVSAKSLRHASAAVLVGFALIGMWRTLYHPNALAQGPFCLVP